MLLSTGPCPPVAHACAFVRRALFALTLGAGLAACGGSDDRVAPPPPAAPTAPADVADACPALSLAPGVVAPASATGAYLCAAGIGVTDLTAAVNFYKALGLREKARLTRADREEVVLASADGRGSHLVLFRHTDGATRDYRQNPGKLVFYVKDAAASGASLVAAGGTLTSPPVPYQGRLVGFGRDLDNNLVEIASDAAARHSYLSAVGVGVSDLEAARAFYVDALDMKVLAKLTVGKPDGAGGTTPWYDEYILQSSAGKGAAVVLMHYTDGSAKVYADRPVKLSWRVDDPVTYAARIAGAGKPVVSAPARATDVSLGGVTVGSAKDGDGTLLEIFKAPQAEACAPIAPASVGASAPASATGAYLCAAGVGVADLDASVAFYKAAFGMTERARLARADRSEVVLDSADRRGSQLVLYRAGEGGAGTPRPHPGKVVFYVKDAAASVAAVQAAGGQASPPVAYAGRQVSFGRDPDGNLVEITSEPTAVASYLSAFGIGVSDLEAARAFYVDTLDFKVLTRLSVTKAPGVPWYDEYILTSPAGRGSAVVLMHFTDGSAPAYKDNAVKLALRVDQPGRYARRIFDAGLPVLTAPTASPDAALGEALVGLAADADGTRLEILSSPN